MIRGFILLFAAVVLFLTCCNFMRFVQQRRKPVHFMLNVILFAVCYMLIQLMIEFAEFPLLAAIIFLAIITAAALYQQYLIIKLQHTRITPISVKESVDNIPKGLCYYITGGLPKLTNTAIEKLCREITGSALMDGEGFWNMLCGGRYTNGAECVQSGSMPVVRLKTGSVYSFKRNELSLEKHKIYEIISSEVTEEYKVSTELKDKQSRVDAINKRLKELNGVITQMTIEKEMLAAKIQVHDNLGNALLGVKVVTEGTLPEEEDAKRLVSRAITACVTNTLRHADGNEIYITSKQSDTEYKLSITNNGNAPQGEIAETGGLKNLRLETESMGGSMKIESNPRFGLTITIPRAILMLQKCVYTCII